MSYDPGNPQQNPQGWQGGQQPYPSGYGQPTQQGQPGQYGQQGQYEQGQYEQQGQHGQQGQYGQQGGWGGSPSGPTSSGRGGLGSLFDFSFNTFATPTLIRIIYIIGTVLLGLGYVGFTIAAFMQDTIAGLVVLVVGVVVVLFYLALLRVSLEFYYAVVRMSEDIHLRR